MFRTVAGTSPKTFQSLDGMDVWEAVISNSSSPRSEVLLTLNPGRGPTAEDPNQKYTLGMSAVWEILGITSLI